MQPVKRLPTIQGAPANPGGACFDLAVSRRVIDATGEGVLRFQPVLRPGVVASGSLSFAFWECGECDGAPVLAATQARALASARDALRAILADVSAGEEQAR